jgi:hypothetical protein
MILLSKLTRWTKPTRPPSSIACHPRTQVQTRRCPQIFASMQMHEHSGAYVAFSVVMLAVAISALLSKHSSID